MEWFWKVFFHANFDTRCKRTTQEHFQTIMSFPLEGLSFVISLAILMRMHFLLAFNETDDFLFASGEISVPTNAAFWDPMPPKIFLSFVAHVLHGCLDFSIGTQPCIHELNKKLKDFSGTERKPKTWRPFSDWHLRIPWNDCTWIELEDKNSLRKWLKCDE